MTLFFKPFSHTEIILLKHLTRINENGVVDQICLVKNPSFLSSTLERKIQEFDEKNPVKGKYFRRLFIKEHNKVWFPGLFLQENVEYESNKITRHDLDNIDFLADSDYRLTKKGEVLKTINVRTGDVWFYKY